jgi:NAD(P) transhydrogenase subunit alpha
MPRARQPALRPQRQALLELFLDDEGNLSLNFDDEVVAGACVVRDGREVSA